jgi:transcriptional regulator with XRE-family HTH domain
LVSLLLIAVTEDKYILIDADLFGEFRKHTLSMSQGKLAMKLGLSIGAVRNWEQGVTEGLYLDNFSDLAKVAGMSVPELQEAIGKKERMRAAAKPHRGEPK